MIKYFSLLMLIGLRLLMQPSTAQNGKAPFTSPASLQPTSGIESAQLIRFSGILDKQHIQLNWIVSDNETADRFEVEKSFDGVHFHLAALVFGTDRSDDSQYRFFEKAGNKKVSYRIKMFSKNKLTAYSSIIEINPHA